MSDERPAQRVEPDQPSAAASSAAGEHLDESRHLLHHAPAGPQAHRIDDVDLDPAAGPARVSRVEEGVDADERPVGQPPSGPREPRPLIERVGMAAIGLVLAALFGAVALAAFSGGEPFLGVMGAVGCLMTVWAGALTLFRG